MAHLPTTQDKPTSPSVLNHSVAEWNTSEVARFFSQTLPKKYPIDMTKAVLKHALTGQDLLELTEQNLQEMGISTIHERKNILRAIKSLKNST